MLKMLAMPSMLRLLGVLAMRAAPKMRKMPTMTTTLMTLAMRVIRGILATLTMAPMQRILEIRAIIIDTTPSCIIVDTQPFHFGDPVQVLPTLKREVYLRRECLRWDGVFCFSLFLTQISYVTLSNKELIMWYVSISPTILIVFPIAQILNSVNFP
jgi:hypothetical protein